jgi:hypothetical protein
MSGQPKVTCFIQSVVCVSGLGKNAVKLPPVVGRSFAAFLARLVHADFPTAVITIHDKRHTAWGGLAKALATSDEVAQMMKESIAAKHGGSGLMTGLGLIDKRAEYRGKTGLAQLLLAERGHAAEWWSVLNEMRIAKQLPEWVACQVVGTHAEYEHYDKTRQAFNLTVFALTDLYPGDNPAMLEADQQTLIELIETERTYSARWWSMLNGMRAREQLPAWVIAKKLGHGPDVDQWHAKKVAVNLYLFGVEHVRSVPKTDEAAQYLRNALKLEG